MVRASPTSTDARDAEPGLAVSTRLGAYRAKAPQVGCRGTLAAAILSIELTSRPYRSRLSDRRGLRVRGPLAVGRPGRLRGYHWGGIQRRAFDSEPCRTGSDGAVTRAGTGTTEVRAPTARFPCGSSDCHPSPLRCESRAEVAPANRTETSPIGPRSHRRARARQCPAGSTRCHASARRDR
jgi:hypothetical protein